MRVAVFGPLRVTGLAEFQRRDRTVLAALVVHRRAVSVDTLAAALWGDTPPTSARKVLQGSIVRWRRVLGDTAIRTEPRGYRLDREAVEVDIDAFTVAVERARTGSVDGYAHRVAHDARQALDAWTGPPLPELADLPSAVEEVGRLEALRADAEILLGRALLDLGRFDEAAHVADRAIDARPYDEAAWEVRIRADAALGRASAALESLRRLRCLLRDELGLEPGPGILGLERAVLRRDPALLRTGGRVASPWPGLLPFDGDDADRYFGREDELATAEQTLARSGRLVVVGRSGCGKSSFVRAGLAVRLGADGAWPAVLSPGGDPLSALGAAGSGDVIVDQAEEVLTQCTDDTARTAFFAALAARPSRVVVVVRADLLDELSRFAGFAAILDGGLQVLRPMDEDRMRAAVQATAAAVGLRLQPGLVELVLRDSRGEAAALPMVSHALAATCAAAEGDLLTVSAYRASGGVEGAIEATAEAVHEALDPADRAILRTVVSRLVSTQGGSVVRLRVEASTVDDRVRERLIEARLLAVADDGRVQLAHESLVDHWSRLRGWIAEDEAGRRLLQHLAAESAEWVAAGEPDDLLYRGSRLHAATGWAKEHRGAANETEQRFLAASSRAVRTSAGARRRRTAVVSAAGSVLLVAVAAAALVAVDRQRVAQAASDDGDAQRVGAAAVVVQNPSLALALTAESLALHDSPATRSSALEVFGRFADLLPTGTPPAPLPGGATAPGGDLTATVDGNAIELVSAAGGVPGRLTGAGYPPNAIAFDRAGRLLAASISDPGFPDSATTIVWDVATRREVARFDSGDGAVDANVFATDSESVWATGDDGVHHWDLTGANALTRSAAGEPTAFRSESGLLTVWDASVRPWIRRACALAGRPLTAREWGRYLPGRPYAPVCRISPP